MAAQPLYTVSQETLRRVTAEMAGLSFTDEELERLTPQMAALLSDLSALEALDLRQVEPAMIFVCAEGTETPQG